MSFHQVRGRDGHPKATIRDKLQKGTNLRATFAPETFCEMNTLKDFWL